MQTANDAWRQLSRAARAQISPALYRVCFAGTAGVATRNGELIVAVPSASARDQLTRRFTPLLSGLALQLLRPPVALRFVLANDSAGARLARPAEARTAARPLAPPDPGLNPRYTFASFVVGDSNRFVYAAAASVAAAPGASYNPLFLYGGVGLGKTHLLMAIGHAALARQLRVGFVTAETFTNEIIQAIQANAQDDFRARYRAFDVLLVDDIQFIGGRERTEEEFFHTFNALHLAGKQIVVTSDRAPRAIPTLHDRLRSRFEWGLLADITTPSYDLRLEILRTKAAALPLAVPEAVLELIARPEGVSVRALEGALNRLVVAAGLHGGRVTLALAATTLRDFFGESLRLDVSPAVVLELVANHFRVEVADLLGKSRNHAVAWPRQVAMYLLREESAASLAQIGAALGGRDHTTIMHGCEQVTDAVKFDDHARREIESLQAALRAM